MGYILSIESDLAGNHQTIRIIIHAEMMLKKKKEALQVLQFYVSATEADREAKVLKCAFKFESINLLKPIMKDKR